MQSKIPEKQHQRYRNTSMNCFLPSCLLNRMEDYSLISRLYTHQFFTELTFFTELCKAYVSTECDPFSISYSGKEREDGDLDILGIYWLRLGQWKVGKGYCPWISCDPSFQGIQGQPQFLLKTQFLICHVFVYSLGPLGLHPKCHST
jgi:hypothetical protein